MNKHPSSKTGGAKNDMARQSSVVHKYRKDVGTSHSKLSVKLNKDVAKRRSKSKVDMQDLTALEDSFREFKKYLPCVSITVIVMVTFISIGFVLYVLKGRREAS